MLELHHSQYRGKKTNKTVNADAKILAVNGIRDAGRSDEYYNNSQEGTNQNAGTRQVSRGSGEVPAKAEKLGREPTSSLTIVPSPHTLSVPSTGVSDTIQLAARNTLPLP